MSTFAGHPRHRVGVVAVEAAGPRDRADREHRARLGAAHQDVMSARSFGGRRRARRALVRPDLVVLARRRAWRAPPSRPASPHAGRGVDLDTRPAPPTTTPRRSIGVPGSSSGKDDRRGGILESVGPHVRRRGRLARTPRARRRAWRARDGPPAPVAAVGARRRVVVLARQRLPGQSLGLGPPQLGHVRARGVDRDSSVEAVAAEIGEAAPPRRCSSSASISSASRTRGARR